MQPVFSERFRITYARFRILTCERYTHTTCFPKHQKPPEVKRKAANRMMNRIFANENGERKGDAESESDGFSKQSKCQLWCNVFASCRVCSILCEWQRVSGCLLHCNAVHSTQTVRLGRCDDL